MANRDGGVLSYGCPAVVEALLSPRGDSDHLSVRWLLVCESELGGGRVAEEQASRGTSEGM